MGSVIFNFYNDDRDIWLSSFCKYFKLNKKKVLFYLKNANSNILSPNLLVSDLGLNLNNYNSNTVEIVCRHFTTTLDDTAKSFHTFGLLDLKSVLQSENSLSHFLEEHGIKVNVDDRLLIINSKPYYISLHGEPCTQCFESREKQCGENSRCSLRKSIDNLGLKLYYYEATLEFFIHASFDEMMRYSTISRHPEILYTLDTVLDKLSNGLKYDLSYDWVKKHKKCFILEFSAKLSDMETFAPISYKTAYNDIYVCIEQSGYDYDDYIDKVIPQTILDNFTLIRWFISVYFNNIKVLGSLLPNKIVEPEKIKVIEVEDLCL